MAAMLIEIKSRMLLPRPEKAEEGEELDPRAELVRRLLEYEQMKLAARNLDGVPQLGRDFRRSMSMSRNWRPSACRWSAAKTCWMPGAPF
jgi:chromatin segregation and condensation protein Rec8/ScpA/Scc1 (kleisin family)